MTMTPTTKTRSGPAHMLRPGTTTSNGRAPAKPLQPHDQFDYPALKVERTKKYATRVEKNAAAPLRISNSATTSLYSGEELAAYQGRPGSQDFLNLPSLMGSKRIYRKDAV